MHARRHRQIAFFVTGVCAALGFMAGCAGQSGASEDGTFFGPSARLGDGTVKTYATLDKEGHPTEVGVRMTAAALDGLPSTGDGPPLALMLALPDQAAATAFDHVMLDWNPQGHDPIELFGKPHFDIHFNMVDMATMQAINPADPNYAAKAERAPAPKYVPQDYAIPPTPPIAAQAAPQMGVHWVDTSDTSLLPGTYDFKQIIINGTWDGRYTFIEPMITRDGLLTRPRIQQTLKQPQAYHESGYYPTTYATHVDDRTNEYIISLGSLTMRTAS